MKDIANWQIKRSSQRSKETYRQNWVDKSTSEEMHLRRSQS